MFEELHQWRWVLFALVVIAAISDIRSFRIPNAIPLMAVGALVVILVAISASPETFAAAALSGLIGLVIGYVLFAIGVMGGGDGKLFAASAAWFSAGALLNLGFWISLSGVGVAAAVLALRVLRQEKSAAGNGGSAPPALKTPVPYGVAIAAGVIIASQINAPL